MVMLVVVVVVGGVTVALIILDEAVFVPQISRCTEEKNATFSLAGLPTGSRHGKAENGKNNKVVLVRAGRVFFVRRA